MSEYWKSTPKYWCKHCSTYVRDTKLERSNHDATGKHQGALKRFLRDLHRGHDQEQRDKERAKREVDRLNGVVAGTSSSTPATVSRHGTHTATTAGVPGQRQQQWEQLAEMGIEVPNKLRSNMALAGEWSVTKTRIIDDSPKIEEDGHKVDAIATGVRKRTRPNNDAEAEAEEVKDEEDKAVQGLFKKPRKWGRATRQAPEDDTDLDALLRTSLVPVTQPKAEEEKETREKIKEEEEAPSLGTKREPAEDARQGVEETKDPTADVDTVAKTSIKREEEKTDETVGTVAPAVFFKKRKPKITRQK